MWLSIVATHSLFLSVALCGPFGSKAVNTLARRDTSSDGQADPLSTKCGKIVVAANQGYDISYASDVKDCLLSLPFNPAVATRFLDYYNTTIQFQSTLAYLRDPPLGYQQPPIDVLERLNLIQHNVATGVYRNQYAFEADLQRLVQQTHDTHVRVTAGALSAFAFASPRGLVSASRDGKTSPQIYFMDDVIDCQNDLRHERCIPSPIVQINGVDAIEFLTNFAELNAFGYLERHSDFNSLMESPAADIQGVYSDFKSLTFYPGNDSDKLNFTYQNTSTYQTFWLGRYLGGSDTGPLETPGDFYNYFVLGLPPASYVPDVKWWPDLPTGTISGSSEVTPDYGCRNNAPNWCKDSYGAFPDSPNTTQVDLSVVGFGIVSGYFLDELSTGVLSIPSFLQFDADVGTFSEAVASFLGNATARNMSRIIIDLQKNSGGSVDLVFDVFKQFFSSIEPYAGSRMRSHELSNILGSSYTNWWNSLQHDPNGPDGSGANGENYKMHAADEWVITDRINAATGKNFTSWQEHQGPLTLRGDNFSLTQRYNLSSQIFDEAASEGWVPTGYGSRSQSGKGPLKWLPKDIVILTDGLCASACALFVELMVHQADIRTVTLGGLPINGPMQAVGGTRGARDYDAYSLDQDIEFLNETITDHLAASRLPQRESKILADYIGFNLRDQIRENDSTPLQFQYQAADCRLFFTLNNVYNMTRLWQDVAHAAWIDPSMCVTNSTGYPTGRNATFDKEPPHFAAKAPGFDLNFQDHDTTTNFMDPIMDGVETGSITPGDFRMCDPLCPGGCITASVKCTGNDAPRSVRVCAPSCKEAGEECKTKGKTRAICRAHSPATSRSNRVRDPRLNDASGGHAENAYIYKCQPYEGGVDVGCSS